MTRQLVIVLAAVASFINGGCCYADQSDLEVDYCAARNQSGLGDGKSNNNGDPIPRPGDNALHWIYAMANLFLEDFVETTSLSDTLEAITETGESKEPILTYLTGYIIALIVGLLFILAVPIMGCCFCICRTCCCCCCCCCKKDNMEGKHAKCKRITCGSCFFVLAVILTIGMAFAFASASFLRDQFQADGMMNNLAMSLEKIDGFTADTVEDFWDLKDDSIDPMLLAVGDQIEVFPDQAYKELGESTGVKEDLDKLKTYTDQLEPAQDAFKKMDKTLEDLIKKETELNNAIVAWNAGVKTELKHCETLNPCKDVIKRADGFKETLDFTSLSDLKGAIDAIEDATTNTTTTLDIGTWVGISVTVWEGIGSAINNVSSKPLNDMTETLSTFSEEIEGFMNHTSELSENLNTDNIQKVLREDIGPSIEKLSPIIYAVLLLPCFIPLIIAFVYLLGLVIGVATGPPGKKFCNRGKGACCLMCGVSCTFLFSWLVMLFVTLFFLIGSISHNVFCKHLVAPSESEDIDVINNFLQKSMNMNVSILQVIEDCGDNKAMYTALQIEKIYPGMNITEILDLSRLGFEEILKKIDNLEVIKDEKIELMHNDTELHLFNLNAEFSQVAFEQYSKASEQPITNEPIDDLIRYIDNEMTDATDPDVKNSLDKINHDLRNVKVSHIAVIQSKMKDLGESTAAAEAFVGSLDIPKFIPEMKNAQEQVNDEQIQKIVKGQAMEIYKELEKLSGSMESSVRCDIGKCKSLYSMAEGLISSVCVFVLYPMNGYWFCLGWCAAFFVPLLIFAVVLVGQYRKTARVAPLDEESMASKYVPMAKKAPPRRRPVKGGQVAPAVTPL